MVPRQAWPHHVAPRPCPASQWEGDRTLDASCTWGGVPEGVTQHSQERPQGPASHGRATSSAARDSREQASASSRRQLPTPRASSAL